MQHFIFLILSKGWKSEIEDRLAYIYKSTNIHIYTIYKLSWLPEQSHWKCKCKWLSRLFHRHAIVFFSYLLYPGIDKKNSFSTALFLSLVFLSCNCLSVLNLQPQWTRITKFWRFTRMMSLKLLLALALVAVVTGSQEFEVGTRRRREVCAEHSNGCSIPGDLPFFYKHTFTPACDRHDMCYNCVSTLDR